MIHKFDWTQMIDRSIVCLFFSINRLIDWLNQWIKLTFGCWLVRWPCRLWVGRRLSLWKARSARKRWEEFWRKILSSLWRSAPSGLPRQSLTRAHRFPIQKSNCCKNLICIFRLLLLISTYWVGVNFGNIFSAVYSCTNYLPLGTREPLSNTTNHQNKECWSNCIPWRASERERRTDG